VSDDDARLIAFIAAVLLWLPSMLWSGYALSTIWAWHVAPLGAPAIGVLEAAGVALVVGYLTKQVPHQETDDGYLYRSIGWIIFRPAVAIGIGWIIKVLG